jgi:glucose/mannose-6-phosphate isomerase
MITTNTQQDTFNLRRVIFEEGKQFQEGISVAKGVSLPGSYDSITISGMGGSALPGNILRILLHRAWRTVRKKPISIYQNRFYSLPPEAYRNSLNLICSHSGNTEETLASFEEAIANKLPVVGIASGGKLEALCREYGVPFVKLPIPFDNFQPRMATGHFVSAIHTVLADSGIIEDDSENLLRCGEYLQTIIPELETKGMEIAERIAGKTPVVYADTYLKSLAMIWKIKINENAKTPAFWNYFPELNHNEMVGFTLPQGKFIAILLRDVEDDPRNAKRFDITADLMRKQGVDTMVLDISGEGAYNKVFGALALGDWASYHLALLYGIDPTPVDMVEELKVRLKG